MIARKCDRSERCVFAFCLNCRNSCLNIGHGTYESVYYFPIPYKLCKLVCSWCESSRKFIYKQSSIVTFWRTNLVNADVGKGTESRWRTSRMIQLLPLYITLFLFLGVSSVRFCTRRRPSMGLWWSRPKIISVGVPAATDRKSRFCFHPTFIRLRAVSASWTLVGSSIQYRLIASLQQTEPAIPLSVFWPESFHGICNSITTCRRWASRAVKARVRAS